MSEPASAPEQTRSVFAVECDQPCRGRFRAGPALSFEPFLPALASIRVLAMLGEGGMGTVYQAQQQNTHRIVALNVIKLGVATDQLLRRFEQEAEALRRLQHPLA
jgi:serine/threonine protein kinase